MVLRYLTMEYYHPLVPIDLVYCSTPPPLVLLYCSVMPIIDLVCGATTKKCCSTAYQPHRQHVVPHWSIMMQHHIVLIPTMLHIVIFPSIDLENYFLPLLQSVALKCCVCSPGATQTTPLVEDVVTLGRPDVSNFLSTIFLLLRYWLISFADWIFHPHLDSL